MPKFKLEPALVELILTPSSPLNMSCLRSTHCLTGGKHLGCYNHEDEDDGPIQRSTQVPHPRVHQCIQWDHPVDNILGSIRRGVTTYSRLASFCEHYSFISPLEPHRVEDALDDLD